MSKIYKVQATVDTVILVEDDETPETVLDNVAYCAFRDSLEGTNWASCSTIEEVKSVDDLPGEWSGISIPYSTDIFSTKNLSTYLD